MTYIKRYVQEYDELLKMGDDQILVKYRKYDCLTGDTKSVEYVLEVIKKLNDEQNGI